MQDKKSITDNQKSIGEDYNAQKVHKSYLQVGPNK